MNKLKIVLLASSFLFLLSCGSEDKSEKTGVVSNKNSTKTSDCLAKFDYDYSKLLTKEDVLKHVTVADPSIIKTKFNDNKKMNAQEYGDCTYSWPSDRPDMDAKVLNKIQKIKDVNTVSISKLMFEDGDLADIQAKFQRAYKALSQAEVDDMNAKMDKQFEGKSAEALETAKGFIQARTKLKFEPIEGLGDLAYWKKATELGADWGAELIVLVGKVKFTIKVKISSDINENIAVAQKMAQEVLDKCK